MRIVISLLLATSVVYWDGVLGDELKRKPTDDIAIKRVAVDQVAVQPKRNTDGTDTKKTLNSMLISDPIRNTNDLEIKRVVDSTLVSDNIRVRRDDNSILVKKPITRVEDTFELPELNKRADDFATKRVVDPLDRNTDRVEAGRNSILLNDAIKETLRKGRNSHFSYLADDGTHRDETLVLKTIGKETVPTYKGSVKWKSPEGRIYDLVYEADELGYRAKGDYLPEVMKPMPFAPAPKYAAAPAPAVGHVPLPGKRFWQRVQHRY